MAKNNKTTNQNLLEEYRKKYASSKELSDAAKSDMSRASSMIPAAALYDSIRRSEKKLNRKGEFNKNIQPIEGIIDWTNGTTQGWDLLTSQSLPTPVDTAYNFQQALDFDGVDDFVGITELTSSTQTISFWVNFDSIKGTEPIIGGEATADYFRLQNANNRIQVRSFLGNNNNFTIPTLSNSTWYHVLYAANGTVGRLFLNGVESSSGSLSANSGYTWNRIGHQTNSNFLNGKLDDVMLTNTVVADPQAAALAIYNGGAGADPLITFPAAQQLYRFNNNANNDGSLGGVGTLNNFIDEPYVAH